MDKEQLEARTKQFAVRVMKLVEAMPRSTKAQVISEQQVRCGTAVGANYRACCRARSIAEFISKLGIVEEEADESAFWLELIIEDKILPEDRVKPLLA